MIKINQINPTFYSDNLSLINDTLETDYTIAELNRYGIMFLQDIFDFYIKSPFNLYADDIENVNNYVSDTVALLFIKNNYKYSHLAKTLTQDYNIINNYDKNSTIEITKTGKIKNTKEYGDIETINKFGDVQSVSQSNSTIDNDIRETKQSNVPFDHENFQDTTKETTKGTTDTSQDNSNVTTTHDDDKTTLTHNSDSDSTEFENYKETTTEHTLGNIGVTTSAQMIEGERKIADFSLWQVINKDLRETLLIFPCDYEEREIENEYWY